MANGQTTGIVDTTYCPLGIFDSNTPLLYGEKEKAFRRLQEEVIKTTNDMTIFFGRKSQEDTQISTGVFAKSQKESQNMTPYLSLGTLKKPTSPSLIQALNS